MLYCDCVPMGLCRLSLSQRARALNTLSASQLEVAQQKALPSSMISWKPLQISSSGVSSSQRWAQRISTQSSWSLLREALMLSLMCFLLMRRLELISGSAEVLILVATMISYLSTFRLLRILPSCVSALPASQTSAVSKWLTPLAKAKRTMSSSTAQFSYLELIMLPREITEVLSPELPKLRQSILPVLNTDISNYFIFSDGVVHYLYERRGMKSSKMGMDGKEQGVIGCEWKRENEQKGVMLCFIKERQIMDNQHYELPQKFWCYKKAYQDLLRSRALFKQLFQDYHLCMKCIFRLYGFQQPRIYSDSSFYIQILPSLLGLPGDSPLLRGYHVGQCCLDEVCWSCESIFQRSYLREIVEQVKEQIKVKGYEDWAQFKLNIRIPNVIILKNLILVRYIYSQIRVRKDEELDKMYYNILILPVESNKVVDHKTILKWLLANELNEHTSMTSTSDQSDDNLVISLELEQRDNGCESRLMKVLSSYLGLEKKKEKAKGRKNCIDLGQGLTQGQGKGEVNHPQQFKCNAHNMSKVMQLRQAQFDSVFHRLHTREQFWQFLSGTPSIPVLTSTSVTSKLALLTRNVYLCGRYIKYSRYLSQTPWLVNGKKLTEGSLQQEIEDRIFQLFFPNQKKENIEIRFHSGGREDIDVRMLKGGRPFVLEFVNPIKSIKTVTEEDVMAIVPEEGKPYIRQEFDKWVSNNQGNTLELHSWRVVKLLELLINFENQYVQVLDLQETTESYISVQLKAAETEKIKHYLCYIYSVQPLTEEDKTTLQAVKDLSLQQLTPLRVLHRRTLLSREKTIHRLKLHLVSVHSGILQVWASAGTYIKQFVHGDLGRTTPNIGSLLSKQIDILQLDVGSLKQGQWKAGDEQLMKMQKFQWMD